MPRPVDVWLAAGVRTPFARVDGPLRRLDAIELSVPVARDGRAADGRRARPRGVGRVAPTWAGATSRARSLIEAASTPPPPPSPPCWRARPAWSAVFEAAGMLAATPQLALCGGVESMSRVQIGLGQGLSDWLRRFRRRARLASASTAWASCAGTSGCTCRAWPTAPPARAWASTTRRCAKEWNIARADQDRIALQATSAR